MNQRPLKKSTKPAKGLGQSPKKFRRESRKPNPKVMVQRSPTHGLGLWAQAPIKKGEFLAEYVGQMITPEENERLQSHTEDPNHTFSFGLECGMIIDGGVEGNISRYINHSCDPNAEFQEVEYAPGCPLEKNSRLYIYATQDIAAGEEIFFDYSLQHGGPYTQELKDRYKCMCGSANCRGTMLDLSYKPKRSPKERVEDLEEQVESLIKLAEKQGQLIEDMARSLEGQAALAEKLSGQLLKVLEHCAPKQLPTTADPTHVGTETARTSSSAEAPANTPKPRSISTTFRRQTRIL